MTAAKPLLIFDSGVGGLSVLGAIQRILPNAPIVYAADNAGFPYGTKSEAEIASRVPALLGRLSERYDPRLIVIACNTASTIALDTVRSALDLPVIGTVPAIKPGAQLSRTRVMGVLGTNATVRQPYVDRLSHEFASDCTILRHGSSELVELAEAKLRGEIIDAAAYQNAISGLLEQPQSKRMDTVVLACTHFPLVQEELQCAVGRAITFVDGKEGIARRAAFLTKGDEWPPTAAPGVAVFTRSSPMLTSYSKAFADYRLLQTHIL